MKKIITTIIYAIGKNHSLLLLLVLGTLVVQAQTVKTANTATTLWNTPGHWTPNGVPSASDEVVIPSSVTTLTIDATTNPSIAKLTVEGTTTINISGGNSSGKTLTISGDLELGEGCVLTPTAPITVQGNVKGVGTAGSRTISGNITTGTASAGLLSAKSFSGTHTIIIGSTGAGTFAMNSNVNLDAPVIAGALTVGTTSTLTANATDSFSSITISGVSLTIAGTGNTRTGTITLTSNSSLTTNASSSLFATSITRSASNQSGTTITNNGSIFVRSDPSVAVNTLTNNSGSTFAYEGVGAQTVTAVSYHHLIVRNGNTKTLGGNITVNGNLTIGSNTSLQLSTHTQTLNGNLVVEGTLTSSGASTSLFSGSSSQQVISGSTNGVITFHNLTISNPNGVKASKDITVNGVLNLNSANPSAHFGLLEMVADYTDYAQGVYDKNTTYDFEKYDSLRSYVLLMGASATTSGTGDVTGIIRRTNIANGTSYTFGNAKMLVSFNQNSTGTLPTDVQVYVTIGNKGRHISSPDSLAATQSAALFNINRLYQIRTKGASNPATFNITLPYLDAELPQGFTDESNLVLWDHHLPYAGATPHEHGKTTNDPNANTVTLSGQLVSYTGGNTKTFSKYWMIAKTLDNNFNRWTGAFGNGTSTDWTNISNWTKGSIPADGDNIKIQSSSLGGGIPSIPSSSIASTLMIEEGGVLNGSAGSLTLTGTFSSNNVPVWNNLGTFNPGTSTIKFSGADIRFGGNNSFYNLEVTAGTKTLTPDPNSILRIQNTIVLGSGASLNAVENPNTIIYEKENTQIGNNIPEYYTLGAGNAGIKIIEDIGVKQLLLDDNTITLEGQNKLKMEEGFVKVSQQSAGKLLLENQSILEFANNSTEIELKDEIKDATASKIILSGSKNLVLLEDFTIKDDLLISGTGNLVVQKQLTYEGPTSNVTGQNTGKIIAAEENSIIALVPQSGSVTITDGLFKDNTLTELDVNNNPVILNSDLIITSKLKLNNTLSVSTGKKLVLKDVDFELGTGSNTHIDATATNAEIEIAPSTNQKLPPSLFKDNKVNKLKITAVASEGAIELEDNLLVENTLSMEEGNIKTGINKLTIGSGPNNPGTIAHTKGKVLGTLERYFAATQNTSPESGLFPMGNIEDGLERDRSMTVYYTTAPTTGGSLTCSFILDDMGKKGLPQNYFGNATNCNNNTQVVNTYAHGFWRVNSTIDGGLYDISLVGDNLQGLNFYSCAVVLLKRADADDDWVQMSATTFTAADSSYKQTGVSGWSDWGFGADQLSPLPVSISRFVAQQQSQKVVVSWTSMLESPNEQYEVLKSTDGNQWRLLQTVYAKGSASETNDYAIIDETPSVLNYYMIRYSNEYGSIQHTAPVWVKMITQDQQVFDAIYLYPNPSQGRLFIDNKENYPGISVKVYDVLGKELLNEHLKDTKHKIDLSPGVYFIELQQGSMSKKEKIVVY